MTGKERLAALFDSANSQGRAVFMPYLTVGLPDPESSVAMFTAMAEAGADAFEVGFPYSDPLMDGPTIHEAGLAAIQAGTTVAVGFDLVAQIAATTGKPVIVMTYVNPVLAVGIETFVDRLVEAGACALIVSDIAVGETQEITAACSLRGIGYVQFVAPTTGTDRLREIVATDPVFVYGIAELGVTGERRQGSSNLTTLAATLRAVSEVPLVFGVGISNPEQAAAAAAVGDGVIVGSALVRRVLESNTPEDAVTALRSAVKAFASAMTR
ncbi:MAG: tryptophan synthase subunit alpha [Actinobacteria bacterium]|nr:tryptophan synthase subunit alpha [Actinomycetota bacterium]